MLIRGIPYGGSKDTPVWHFPEKEYAKEESLRKVIYYLHVGLNSFRSDLQEFWNCTTFLMCKLDYDDVHKYWLSD